MMKTKCKFHVWSTLTVKNLRPLYLDLIGKTFFFWRICPKNFSPLFDFRFPTTTHLSIFLFIILMVFFWTKSTKQIWFPRTFFQCCDGCIASLASNTNLHVLLPSRYFFRGPHLDLVLFFSIYLLSFDNTRESRFSNLQNFFFSQIDLISVAKLYWFANPS